MGWMTEWTDLCEMLFYILTLVQVGLQLYHWSSCCFYCSLWCRVFARTPLKPSKKSYFYPEMKWQTNAYLLRWHRTAICYTGFFVRVSGLREQLPTEAKLSNREGNGIELNFELDPFSISYFDNCPSYDRLWYSSKTVHLHFPGQHEETCLAPPLCGWKKKNNCWMMAFRTWLNLASHIPAGQSCD